MGIRTLALGVVNVAVATRRAAWLMVVPIVPLAALAIVLWLEILSALQRVLCLYSRSTTKSKRSHSDSYSKSGPLDWLTTPVEPGTWLAYWSSSILVVRLHANIPLVALFARWVVVHRPDLLERPCFLRMLNGLREEELYGPGSRPGGRLPADQRALEHVHASLTAALGAGWSQGMRLDPLAVSSDCVVESYSAVLREDLLDASQQARKASTATSRVLSAIPVFWCCRRRRKPNEEPAPIAETTEARRAVVRVRRKGVAEASVADLRIARFMLALAARLGLCGPRELRLFETFASFVQDQLDLRNEARLLRLCHAALPRGEELGLAFPRLYGEAGVEVLIVSLEDGVCMSEVLRRRRAPMDDEAEADSRAIAAADLMRAFWTAALDHGLVLGGLSLGNLLLRSAGCGNELEVLALRAGLAHEIDEQMREDLRTFAACLTEGPAEMLGPFLLERVHLPSGGALGAVRDPDAFASGVRNLAELACGQPSSERNAASGQGAPAQLPLRGAALLQRALALASKHGVRVGPRHLQLAAAVAGIHGICGRLDPAAAGRPLLEMQAVIGTGVGIAG